MFDYQGLPEKELLELCIERKDSRANNNLIELYSYDVWYRDYARYPHNKPLYIYTDHGAEDDEVGKHEVYNDAEAMFVFSDQKLLKYKSLSTKPCYKVLNPFVWYRQQYVTPISNRKGTLVFPAHSTTKVTSEYDFDKYCRELKELPEEMQPICVCLYYVDIKDNGHHKEFMKNGIPVYTVGQGYNKRFAERFYDLLNHFKYTMSNMLGSYAFYSVEMGIPFSLYGPSAIYQEHGIPEEPTGDAYEKKGNYAEGKKLFQGIQKEITQAQRDYVLNALGYHGGLTREEMNSLLNEACQKRPKRLAKKILISCIKGMCNLIPSRQSRRQMRERLCAPCYGVIDKTAKPYFEELYALLKDTDNKKTT